MLSYGELDARANRLARALARAGVGPDAPVAVCLERSLDLIVSVLGILKAGGAYLAIDPENPPETWDEFVEASIALTGTPKYRDPYVTVLDEDHRRFARIPTPVVVQFEVYFNRSAWERFLACARNDNIMVNLSSRTQ